MKRILLLVVMMGISAIGQTKKQLQAELYNYSKSQVMNIAYDKPFDEVWDAVYIVQNKEYPTIRQDKTLKVIEGEVVRGGYRENMVIEILGNGPYRLAISFRSENRVQNSNGTYSIDERSMISEEYSYRVQYQIHMILYGGHTWPADLISKIDNYNNKQKSDKKKLVKGVDY